MTDFYSSDAGQHASIAKQFLEAALTLSVAQHDKGKILFRPTLALAGHGLELMLKACCYLNNEPPQTKGRKGHDILSLWSADVCEPVRCHLFSNSYRVAEEDRASGDYPDVPDNDDVLPLIEDSISGLCQLHGLSGYRLRYPSDPSQEGPSTPFLVRSLWATADDFVKRPSEFDVRRFRGQG